MKIGIDFGTSFSLPAVPYLDTNIVLLPSGKYGIPSVFYYDEFEGVLVGDEAEYAGQGEEAKNLKRNIKMELNSTFEVDGRTFTAKQIVGYILDNVKKNALIAAETKLINEEIEGVVISVPVEFKNNEKEYIKQAAEIPESEGGPGLKVLGCVKEPVAAALAYFKTSLADRTRIFVYDLGGGTCDVAIVEANSSVNEKYTVVDSDMMRIGGKDWDSKLEDYISSEIEKQSGLSMSNNYGYKEKIKRAAIIAKHSFSEKIGEEYRNRVRARVEVNGKNYNVHITKEIFDNLTMGLLDQTLEMSAKLLQKNNAYPVNKIVCVGGSSNMPQVMEGIKRKFPNMELQVYEPEKAIAIGAGIYAQFCDGTDRYLSDIASFSYGTDCYESQESKTKIIQNLIRKGDRLPKTIRQDFNLHEESSESVIEIFESSIAEESYPFKTNDQSFMSVTLSYGEKKPIGYPISISMTLTSDGIFEVSAYDDNGHAVKTIKQLNN